MLLNHPDQEMIKQSCLHYLGDKHQKLDNEMKLQIGDNIQLLKYVGSLGVKGNTYKVLDVSEYNKNYISPPKLPEGQLWVEGKGMIYSAMGDLVRGRFEYILDESDYQIV